MHLPNRGSCDTFLFLPHVYAIFVSYILLRSWMPTWNLFDKYIYYDQVLIFRKLILDHSKSIYRIDDRAT